MNDDAIVTNTTLREMFGYEILEGKVKMKRSQNKKKTKDAKPSQPLVPRASPTKKTSREKVRAKRKVPSMNKTSPRSTEVTPPRPTTSPPLLGLSRTVESSLPPKVVIGGSAKARHTSNELINISFGSHSSGHVQKDTPRSRVAVSPEV